MDLFVYIAVGIGLALILVIGLAALYLLKDIQYRLDQLQAQQLNQRTLDGRESD